MDELQAYRMKLYETIDMINQDLSETNHTIACILKGRRIPQNMKFSPITISAYPFFIDEKGKLPRRRQHVQIQLYTPLNDAGTIKREEESNSENVNNLENEQQIDDDHIWELYTEFGNDWVHLSRLLQCKPWQARNHISRLQTQRYGDHRHSGLDRNDEQQISLILYAKILPFTLIPYHTLNMNSSQCYKRLKTLNVL